MTFFNEFKKYIAKHPKVAAYKPTSEKYDPAQLKDVITKLPEDVVKSMTAEDLMRMQDFITVSTLLHNIYLEFYPELQKRLAEWEAYVSQFQGCDPDAPSSAKWQLMDRIF